jgi:aspartate/methionine/tyrosine aminotransferase
VKRTIDPLNEITISVGASEALFAIMQALLDEGDEVVVLEPAFDMLVTYLILLIVFLRFWR